MALAPLDVWLRLMFRPRAAIPLRYWPRLSFMLLASALATAVTLPERLLLALWFRWRPAFSSQTRGPVFILGYYRSGTTHLQYLLDLDPGLFSPKSIHTLIPQGFICSWTFFRFFLIPFMPATRRIDAMAFGPDLPSEDDIALNNWALASALAGRVVLPRAYRFYERFHDLRNLTPDELSRWRGYQLAFMRKISLLCGGKMLLLKTPSHTARVEALMELFPGAKFIHITRPPELVIRSNVSLLRFMQRTCSLQEPLTPDEIERSLVREYVDTEVGYLETRSKIAQGRLAELRLQDLLADPIGELKRIYGELNLPFTETFERKLLAYLRSTQGYTPNVHPPWSPEQQRRLAPTLAPLIEQFRHDRPTIPAVEVPKAPLAAEKTGRANRKLAALAGLAAAIGSGGAWLVLAHLTQNRQGWIVWPVGIAIGFSILRTARSGSFTLGLWSLILTLLVLLCVTPFNIRAIKYAGHGDLPFTVLLNATLGKLTSASQLLWSFMGLMTAYRVGSRRHS